MKRDDDYDDGDIDDDDDDDNGVYITNTEYKCECFFLKWPHFISTYKPPQIWHALQTHHFVAD